MFVYCFVIFAIFINIYEVLYHSPSNSENAVRTGENVAYEMIGSGVAGMSVYVIISYPFHYHTWNVRASLTLGYLKS